jgi:hypothetical protein
MSQAKRSAYASRPPEKPMRIHPPLLAVVSLAAALLPAQSKLPQRLLFVGEPATARGKAFVEFLGARFASVRAVQRFDELGDLTKIDVVVLDWDQNEKDSVNAWTRDPELKAARRAPLGAREGWTTPVVLLGSAGLNLACTWDVRGGMG